MSPAFSNSDPYQLTESFRNLDHRVQTIEKVIKPTTQASATLEPYRLLDTINMLEARLSHLEKMLDSKSGGITLGTTGSTVTVNKNSVVIRSNEIELIANGKIKVTASSDLVLKGAKVHNN